MKIPKKIFLIFIFVSILVVLFGGFCLAQKQLEVVYPQVPGAETPTTTKTALPEYLKYVFTFSIMVAGLLAFGALIYGGFSYLTSAGDPSKMKDGQDQIMAGFLGLIIILSSYLILNTINPQLVTLGKLPIEPGTGGIKIHTLANCQEDEQNPSFMVNQSMADLTDPDLNWGLDGDKITSIKFLGAPGSLSVTLWANKGFAGAETPVDYPTGDTQPCKPVTPSTYKSISLDWHMPGVYLYTSDNCTGDKYGIDYVTFQSDSATLPDFDDKTKSIKFIYGSGVIEIPKDTPVGERDEILGRECVSQGGEINPDSIGERDDNYLYQCTTQKYAAILHEKENFMGDAMLYDQEQNVCKKLSENLYEPPGGGVHDSPFDISVSSITVYLKPIGEPIGNGVRFYESKNYTMYDDTPECKDKEKTLPFYGKEADKEKVPDITNTPALKYCTNKCDANCEEEFSSMEIDGHFVALLFRHENYEGECEVFMTSDPDFRNNRTGQCGWLGRSDCLSSFIIKARK